MLSGRQVAASRPVANRYTRENNNNKPCVFFFLKFLKQMPMLRTAMADRGLDAICIFFVCVDDALIYVLSVFFK
jgi:hypothetical protein